MLADSALCCLSVVKILNLKFSQLIAIVNQPHGFPNFARTFTINASILVYFHLLLSTDYGRPERKYSHGLEFNPNPKFLGTAEAYFVYHVGPIFQISLSYAFIGCP